MNKETAECVGLWLAEGDNKSPNEITFTNNCFELVSLFDKTLRKIFEREIFKVRLYIYTPNDKKSKITMKFDKINYYKDERATKPCLIWRLASVKVVKKWKKIVNLVIKDRSLRDHLIRGFFAGEGNIKSTIHCHRQIRITQNKKIGFIEEFLKNHKISYKFEEKHRNGYVIYGRKNWDKLAKLKVADLHPDKKSKFWETYNEFKQYHYKKGYLKKEIIKLLNKSYTNKELSKIFKRSNARISDILNELKEENKIKNYRIRSKDYWILNKKRRILISKIKNKYLNILKKKSINTAEISKIIGVCQKSAFKRLKELEKLNLVKRNKNKMWEIIETSQKVVVI